MVGRCGIFIGHPKRGCGDLENDTEKRSEETTVDSLSELAGKRNWKGEAEMRSLEGEVDLLRIKHKSLILAQDERWRRA